MDRYGLKKKKKNKERKERKGKKKRKQTTISHPTKWCASLVLVEMLACEFFEIKSESCNK